MKEENLAGCRLINGEALTVMDKLITEGVMVDAIICDPPYGTTACKWDSVIPFNNYIMLPRTKRSKKLIPFYQQEYILRALEKGIPYRAAIDYFVAHSKEGMWQKLNKLIKPNGAIVLFGSEPFSSALRMSNIKNYKYDWVWEKSRVTGVLNAKKQPLRHLENICVFYKKQCLYKPQGVIGCNKETSTGNNGNGNSDNYGSVNVGKYTQTQTGYPKQKLFFKSVGKTQHPTQKPVALGQYLIRTYTNKGETILDFTAGSGSFGVAAIKENRKFIGIELNEEYYEISKRRIYENYCSGSRLITF